MSTRRLLSPLVILALLVTACGDDSDGGGAFADMEEVLADLPEDGRTDQEREGDTALAAQALLTLSDLPEGWVVEPDEDDDEPLPPGLLDCLGVPEDVRDAFEDDDETSASSDDITLDDASTSSEVYVYPSVAHAEAQYLFFDDSGFAECFEDALRTRFENEAEAEALPLEITELSLDLVDPPDLGDQAIAMHYRFVVEALGREVSGIGDFYSFRVGRSVANMQFTNIGGPFDPALALRLSRLVESRMGEVAAR